MDDPYAHIAAFYDAEFGDLTGDVRWFADVGTGGSLLVLGCGTGRVARALSALRTVVGLDRSAPMLAVATARAPDVRFVQGDLRSFDLGPFAEIAVPNASFNFLTTRADQAACLGCCRRALADGGALLLDLPMPDFGLWGAAETPERPAWEGRVGGELASRTRSVRRFPVAQRLELVDRYFLAGRFVAESALHLRWVLPAELEWMLEACGFWVDRMWGDHACGPLREGCPRLLVRAVRA